MAINQKYEMFKEKLRLEIEEDRKLTYNDRLNKFYDFIEPYIDKEIKYNSSVYKKISSKLTELYFREDDCETVYQIIRRNNIPYEYRNDNLVIKKGMNNE